VRPAERLLPSIIGRYLATSSLGRRIYYYPETGSTNDIALELARGGEPEGTVVVTDFQRQGRGRHGHEWVSPAGNDLLFSMILRPPGDPQSVLPVTLAISLSAAVALARATGAEVGVKWPNDLVAETGKVGGILAEASHRSGRPEFVVVGVGINVNGTADEFPEALRGRAESCRTLAGETLDRASLMADVLGLIETYYQRFCMDGFGALVSAYEARLMHMGKGVRFERGGQVVEGDIVGVGDDGALHVSLRGTAERAALYNEIVEVMP